MKLSFLLITCLFFFACQKQVEDKTILARIDDKILFLDDVLELITPEEWERYSKSQKDELVQDWVRLTLLAQEAENLGLDKQQIIIHKIETARKNILANALLAQKMQEISITEEDLFNYYRLHKSKYTKTQKEFQVQRILIKNEALLDSIKNFISEKSFMEAAKKYSQEPAGKNGGFIGWVNQNEFPAKLWNTLKTLKRYYYQTVQMEDGYHIIRFYDERDVKTEKTFLEVKNEIHDILLKQKQEELYQNLINELKKKSELIFNI
jgi:parvulin-like peptidyl-prolyl isomerase